MTATARGSSPAAVHNDRCTAAPVLGRVQNPSGIRVLYFRVFGKVEEVVEETKAKTQRGVTATPEVPGRSRLSKGTRKRGATATLKIPGQNRFCRGRRW